MNKIVKALFGLSVSALLASCGCSPTEMSVSSSPSSEQSGGSSSSSSESTGTSSDSSQSTSSDSSQSSSSDTSQSSTQPAVQYTLTFDSKGGSAVTAQTIDAGGKFTKPTDPTKEGYDFAGWYKEDTYQNAFDFNAEVTSNITIYAKWTEKVTPTVQYTITFDSKGGSAVAAQTIEAGEKFSIPDDPSKEGYDFAGWYKEEAYENEFDFNAEVTASVTVYAKWTEQVAPVVHYTLTFVTGEGASSIAAQTIDEGQKFIKPANPTKQGYDFAGWYQDAEYQSEFDFDADVTADVTIYAKWTEHITVYSYALARSGNNWEPAAMTKIDDPEKLPEGFDYAYTVGNGVVKLAENEAFRIEVYEDGTKVAPYGSQATIIHGSSYVTADEDHNLVIKAAGNYVIALFHSEEDGFGIVILESEDIYAYTIGEKTGNMTYHIEDDDLRYEARNIEAKAGDAVSFTLNGEPFAYQTESEYLDNDGKVVADGTYTFIILQNGTLLVNKEVLYTAKAGDQDLEFNAYKHEENTEIIVERTKLEAGLAISFTADGEPIEFEIDEAAAAYFENGATKAAGLYFITLTISDEGNSLTATFTPVTGVYGYKVGEGEVQPLTLFEQSQEEIWQGEGLKFKKGDQVTFYKDGQPYPVQFNQDDIYGPYYLDNGVIKFDGTYDINLFIGETKGTLNISRTDESADNVIVVLDGAIIDASEHEMEDISEDDLVAYSFNLNKDQRIEFSMGNVFEYQIYEALDAQQRVYYDYAFIAPFTGTYNFYLDKKNTCWVTLDHTPTTEITAKIGEKAIDLDAQDPEEGNRAVYNVELEPGDMLTLYDGGEAMTFYAYNEETGEVYPDNTIYSVQDKGTYTIFVDDNVQRRVWITLVDEKPLFAYQLGEEGNLVTLTRDNSEESYDPQANKQVIFSFEAAKDDVFILYINGEATEYEVEGKEGLLDENNVFIADGTYDVCFKYEIGKIYIVKEAEEEQGVTYSYKIGEGEAVELTHNEEETQKLEYYAQGVTLSEGDVISFLKNIENQDSLDVVVTNYKGNAEVINTETGAIKADGKYDIYLDVTNGYDKAELWVDAHALSYSFVHGEDLIHGAIVALEKTKDTPQGYVAQYRVQLELEYGEQFTFVVDEDNLDFEFEENCPALGFIDDDDNVVAHHADYEFFVKIKQDGSAVVYATANFWKYCEPEGIIGTYGVGDENDQPFQVQLVELTNEEVTAGIAKKVEYTFESVEAGKVIYLGFRETEQDVIPFIMVLKVQPGSNIAENWQTFAYDVLSDAQNAKLTLRFFANGYSDVYLEGYVIPQDEEQQAAPFYLTGTMNGWTERPTGYGLEQVEKVGEDDQYAIIKVYLEGGSEFKIRHGSDWYPGEGANFSVANDGYYDIYFCPGTHYGEGWQQNLVYIAEHLGTTRIHLVPQGDPIVVRKAEITESDLPEAPEGYQIDGWYYIDHEQGVLEVDFPLLVGAEDIDLFADVTAIEYTISVNLDGGEFQNEYQAPETYTIEDQDIVLPTPVKDGYNFLKWVDGEDHDTTNKIAQGSTGNKTFKAVWVTVDSYTISFETGFDDVEVAPVAYSDGDTLADKKPADPVKQGYDFVCWKLGNDEFDWENGTVESNIQLTALWTAVAYNVNYHLGEGEVNALGNPATYTIEDEDHVLAPATKDGSTFIGWYLDEERTQEITQIESGSTGDLDLYPLWQTPTEFYVRGTAVSGWDIDPENVLYEPASGTDQGVALGIALYQGEFKIANEGWSDGKVYGWIHHDQESRIIGGAAANFSAGEGGNIRCNVNGRYNIYLTNNGYISVELVEALPARPATYGIHHGTGENWVTSANMSPVELTPAEAETLEAKFQMDIALGLNEEFGVKVTNANEGWYDYSYIGDDASKAFVNAKGDQSGNIIAKTADTYHIVVTRAKNGDVKIYISLVKNVVTLNIDGNTDTTIELSVGESLAQPDDPAPKTGYTFVGWYEASEGGEPLVFPLAVNADKTIYARYAANQYRVVFHENGGAGEMADLQFTYDGEQHALTANAFTRDYYNFVKWNTQADGQGTDYANQSEYALLPGLTVDLYAQWTPITYTINYVLDGGVLAEANPTQYTVETATFALHNPTKENYNFTGWYDEGEHHIESITIGSHGNLTLTARWSQKYVLTFHNADVASIEENNEHKFVRPDDPTKTGYEFFNWYQEEGLQNLFNFNATVSGNANAYAKWTAINYSVRFNANGGTGEMANEAYAYDESKALTANAFTKAGYDFAGWALTADGDVVHTDAKVVSNLTSTKNAVVDLYAKWAVHNYTITYNLDEGTNAQANPATYNIEGQDIVLADATKDGYTFVGWYDAEEAGNKITTITHDHKANVTLYARWEQIMVYKIIGSLVGTWDYNNVAAQTITVVDGVGRIEIVAPAGDDTEFGIKDNNEVWYGLNTHEGGNVATTAGVKYVIEFYPNRKGGEGDDKNNFIVISEWRPVIAQMTGKIGESDMDFAECGDPQYAGQVKAIVNAHADDILTFKYNGESIDVIVENVVGNKATLDGDDIKITEDGEMNVYFKAYKNGAYGVYVAPNFGVGIYVRGTAALGWGDAGCVTSTALKEPDDAVNNLGQLLGVSLAVGDFKLAYLNWNEGTWSWTKQGEESRVIGGAGSDSNYFEKGESDDNIHCKVAGLYNIYLTKNGYISIEKTMYAMTFNSNGGSEVAQISVHAGTGAKFVEPSDPEKAGYNFGGWYTDQGCTEAYDWQATPNTSLTVYAKWTAHPYVISYNNIEGATNPQSNPAQYTIEGQDIVLADAAKDGYTFVGWYDAEEAGNKITIIAHDHKADVTLYARWSVINYDISYQLNGGSVASANPATYNIETATFTLNNPTKDGYSFAGWRLNNDGELLPTVTITQGSTGDLSYTAYWNDAYSVTYNGNGNTGGQAPAAQVDIANNTQCTVAGAGTLVKTGYTFNGWNTLANGSGQAYAAGAQVAFNQNTVLFAQWTANSYTVNFEVEEDESVDPTSKSVTYGSTYGALPTATKDGYEFAGWFTSRNGGTEVTSETSVAIVEDQNLYPHWNKISTVTLNVNGGTINAGNVTSYVESKGATLPTNVTKDYYTFAGWFDNVGLNGDPVTTITAQATGNQTFWAKWTPNVVTVTYNANGGTGAAMADSQKSYGAAGYTELSANTYTKTNYHFKEWNTQVDGNGTKYEALSDSDFATSKSLTLYAIWEADFAYRITIGDNENLVFVVNPDSQQEQGKLAEYMLSNTITVLKGDELELEDVDGILGDSYGPENKSTNNFTEYWSSSCRAVNNYAQNVNIYLKVYADWVDIYITGRSDSVTGLPVLHSVSHGRNDVSLGNNNNDKVAFFKDEVISFVIPSSGQLLTLEDWCFGGGTGNIKWDQYFEDLGDGNYRVLKTFVGDVCAKTDGTVYMTDAHGDYNILTVSSLPDAAQYCLYSFGSNADSWPGVSMNYSSALHAYYAPFKSVNTKIIVNIGSNAAQTDDLLVSSATSQTTVDGQTIIHFDSMVWKAA